MVPPPINEHLWWARDQASGYKSVTRLASATKAYADAACEVGAKHNVPVVNLWKAFMEKADFKFDAWKLEEPIPGSLGVTQNDALVELMYDGQLLPRHSPVTLLNMSRRPTLQPCRIRYLLPRADEGHCYEVP